MRIVFLDNLHEMSKLIFRENKKKYFKFFKCRLLSFLPRMLPVKGSERKRLIWIPGKAIYFFLNCLLT